MTISSDSSRVALLAAGLKREIQACSLTATPFDAQSDFPVESNYAVTGQATATLINDIIDTVNQDVELLLQAGSLFTQTDQDAAKMMASLNANSSLEAFSSPATN